MPNNINSIIYTDVDLNFNVHPLNNDINILTNETSINRQLKHIIMSDYRDFKFNIDYSKSLKSLLFEPATTITALSIKSSLDFLINKYINRINLIKIDVFADGVDGYNIEIVYKIFNQIDNITTNLYLQRLR